MLILSTSISREPFNQLGRTKIKAFRPLFFYAIILVLLFERMFCVEKKYAYLLGAVLLIVFIVIGCSKVEIKNPLNLQKPHPVQSVELDNLALSLQQLNTPKLTACDPDKILNFFVQNNIYYIAIRSEDGNSSTLQAFENQAGVLSPLSKFGKDGILTLKAKMLLSITRGIDGVLYYIRDGVHTLKDGNDIVSFKGKTTATKIALLPGEHQAYLYGNDNFTLSDIKDDAFENNTPSFLHNRKAPFRGGLALLQITNDGNIYGGGRALPNGSSIIACFDKKGKLLVTYGRPEKTAKSAITNLIDMAILKDYVCAIDGFTLKLWQKDGTYLGSFSISKLLNNNLRGSKLTVINEHTLGILAYLRNEQTKLVDIQLYALNFPEKPTIKK